MRHWRRFQHYDPAKRQPPWIKNYTELMSSDEYLSLNAGSRAVLHGIWLEYASSQCQLRLDTVSLTRRLNLRVTSKHLASLNHAGFIDIVASKALAEGYQDASARAHDVETETEEEKNPKAVTSTETPEPIVGATNGLRSARALQAEVAASLRTP